MLRNRSAWMTILQAEGVVWTSMSSVLHLAVLAMQWQHVLSTSSSLEVNAVRIVKGLGPLADTLDLPVPPETRRNPHLVEQLSCWLEDQLEAFADGSGF